MAPTSLFAAMMLTSTVSSAIARLHVIGIDAAVRESTGRHVTRQPAAPRLLHVSSTDLCSMPVVMT